jgi:hypothetical protein
VRQWNGHPALPGGLPICRWIEGGVPIAHVAGGDGTLPTLRVEEW